ncbi:MAG: hypothetical protein ABIP75_07280 [Pyrinomonadaceae bacterium]
MTMSDHSLERIIGCRDLYYLDSEGNRCEVQVLLGKPLPSAESPEFECPFQIKGLGDECLRNIYGIDAVQSLQLALTVIPSYLDHLSVSHQVRLIWDGREEGYLGFGPAPEPAGPTDTLGKEISEARQRISNAHIRKDLEGAIAEIEDLLQYDLPGKKGVAFYERGKIKESAGALNEAKQDWLEALEHVTEPSNLKAELESAIGQVWENLGDSNKALSWFSKSLETRVRCAGGGLFTLKAILRVNAGEFPREDVASVVATVERAWTVLEIPGKPVLADLAGSTYALCERLEEIADASMIPPDVGDVIAARRLFHIDPNGNEKEVIIEIGLPRISEEITDQVECVYRISGVVYDRFWTSWGSDPIEAIIFALNGIHRDLEHIRDTVKGELRWVGGRDGDLGFSVAEHD